MLHFLTNNDDKNNYDNSQHNSPMFQHNLNDFLIMNIVITMNKALIQRHTPEFNRQSIRVIGISQKGAQSHSNQLEGQYFLG